VEAGPPITSGDSTGRLAFELAEFGRNVERRDRAGLGILREGELVLIDVAERHDARQDRRVLAEHIQENTMRHAPGAPGGQIHRRLRQPFRMRARFEAVHQPAVDQGCDDGAQERRGYGDAENAHGRPDSGSGCIMARVEGGRESREERPPLNAMGMPIFSRWARREVCGHAARPGVLLCMGLFSRFL
jgi:hypothetical protein